MLEVSRNISSTKIDQSTSHLPFDLEAFLEEIIIKNEKNEAVELVPIAPQIAMINAFLSSNYRFIVGVLARRTGKTLISNVLGLITILEPDTDVLIISPNYNLSLISYELQRKFIKSFGLEIVKDNVKDRVLSLSNGSSIRLGSINQVESTVGRSYQMIIFDEAALSRKGEEAFNISLRPTLDRANSKAIFITTPRGRNWLYDFYMRGFSDEFPQWCSIRSDYRENPRIIESDIEEARISMSKAEFRQEYEAEFNELQGAIYSLSSDCIISRLHLDPSHYDVVFGIDFGSRDPNAIVVLFIALNERKAYLVDEFQKADMKTSELAKVIHDFEDKYNPDIIFGDASARQTMWDLAQDYDITCRLAKKSVTDGINFVSSLLDNDLLLVDASCTESINAISNYQWKEAFNSHDEYTKEKPLHNEYSHLCDAIRYGLYSYSQNMGE